MALLSRKSKTKRSDRGWRKRFRRSKRNMRKNSKRENSPLRFEPEELNEQQMRDLQATIDENPGVIVLSGEKLKKYEERMERLMEIFNVDAKLPELELITAIRNNSIGSTKQLDDMMTSSALNLTKEEDNKVSANEISDGMMMVAITTEEERRKRSREDIGKWIDDFSELSMHSSSALSSDTIERFPSSISKFTEDSAIKDGLEMIPENPIENESLLPNLSIMKPTQHLLENANMTKNTKSSTGKGVETVIMDVPSSFTSESGTSAYINDQTGKSKFNTDPEILEENIPQATPKVLENRKVRQPYPEGIEEYEDEEPLGSLKPQWDRKCQRLEKVYYTYDLTPKKSTVKTNVADSAEFLEMEESSMAMTAKNAEMTGNILNTPDSEILVSNMNNHLMNSSSENNNNQEDNKTNSNGQYKGKLRKNRNHFRDMETQSVVQSQDYDVNGVKHPRTPLTSEGNVFEELKFATNNLDLDKLENGKKVIDESDNERGIRYFPKRIRKAIPFGINEKNEKKESRNKRHVLQEAVLTTGNIKAIKEKTHPICNIDLPTRLVYDNRASHHIAIADEVVEV